MPVPGGVCDELDVMDENIPLLLLGSLRTIREGIKRLARAGPSQRHEMQMIITSIYLSYYDKVKDMTEMNELLPADVRQSVKHAIEDLGLEEMIAEIGIDKVIGAVGIDKVIDVVGADKLKEALARREAGKRPGT